MISNNPPPLTKSQPHHLPTNASRPPPHTLRPAPPLLHIPAHPPAQRPPEHPVLTPHFLLDLPLPQRGNHIPAPQPSQQHLVLGPREIHHTVLRHSGLLPGRAHHAVDAGAQHPRREHGHRIPKIDDRAARQGPYEQPLRLLVRRARRRRR